MVGQWQSQVPPYEEYVTMSQPLPALVPLPAWLRGEHVHLLASLHEGSVEFVQSAKEVSTTMTKSVKAPVANTFAQLEGPSSERTMEASVHAAPGDSVQNACSGIEPLELAILHEVEVDNFGSVTEAHTLGMCKPCAYFIVKKDGCRQGAECPFCHLCPKGELKKRRKARCHELKAMKRLSKLSELSLQEGFEMAGDMRLCDMVGDDQDLVVHTICGDMVVHSSSQDLPVELVLQ